jgi:Flp pilus assembly pilin Flp
MNMLKRFFRDESGLELSEYAIMAGLIIVLAVVTIIAVGGKINNIFQALDGALGNAEAGT